MAAIGGRKKAELMEARELELVVMMIVMKRLATPNWRKLEKQQLCRKRHDQLCEIRQYPALLGTLIAQTPLISQRSQILQQSDCPETQPVSG
jgi:hypothetical protein